MTVAPRRNGLRTVVTLAATLGPLVVARTGSAQELRYDLRVDLPVTIGGAAVWSASEVLKGHFALAACRWCDRDSAGNDTLNSVDRSVRRLRWGQPGIADWISDVTGFVATPLVAGGVSALAAVNDSRAHGIGADLLVVGEAGVVAADLNQLVKFLVLRERPDVHAARSDGSPHDSSSDDNLSFYSGHTTEAVSLAVAAGTVASMRGYRLAPAVWGTALPFALATGYLRIAADRHYFTDVFAGAIMGALIGVVVPFAFHHPASLPGPTTATGAITSTEPGTVFGWSGVW